MNKDLFLAILSMDSYNRGYETGISGLGGIGTSIGGATLISQSAIGETSAEVAAGFYAAAYSTPWGTVISYRGTDISGGVPYYNDVVNGWAFAVGDFTADQQELSTAFLEQIVRANGFDITLTGHSLGGGLGARH